MFVKILQQLVKSACTMRKLSILLFLVVCSVVSGKTYYVVPKGGSDSYTGLASAYITGLTGPWATWQKAFTTADAGDTVYFREGVWYPTEGVELTPGWKGHYGTYDKPICFFNYPGEKPVLDCKNFTSTGSVGGITVNGGRYLKFRGLTVTNVRQRVLGQGAVGIGITMEGSYLYMDQMVSSHNGGQGMVIRCHDTLYLSNSDSHHNCDSLGNNSQVLQAVGGKGDGYYIGHPIACKVEGDTFKISVITGCRAWNNSDDGFDLGTTRQIQVSNCWAWGSNSQHLSGDGSGFKLSYSDVLTSSKRVVRNCFAAECNGVGFGELNLYLPGPRGQWLNNTAYKTGGGFMSTPHAIPSSWDGNTEVIYRNNIVYHAGTSYTDFEQTMLWAYYYRYPEYAKQDHNTWIPSNDNAYYWEYNPDINWSYTGHDNDFVSLDTTGLSGPRGHNGELPMTNFLHLSPTSDLIDYGVYVGFPYSGSAPDLGYAESLSGESPVPVYLGSVIENATPARLEITYGLTLANIVPAASSFTVKVNTVTRTVNSVAISGTKVLLTLSSPVVYGDAVTVAYSKPATNPLQTSAGGQVASIAAQNVTNNVAAAIPVYVSSVIENAAPARLEITYGLTLANIVPAASSFTVKVNTVTRTVNSVAISGAKVLLTLSSPVVYGDVVTVAYSKPATNPLQTSAGGQVASIAAQNVTNNVAAAIPVYVSSVIENAAPARLEITYGLTLANIVPAASSFTVKVNTVTRTVNSVAISGTKVLLTLSGPVVYGDAVTVAYSKPATNPLQTSAGGQAASFTAQNVINNVAAVIPVYVSSVIENAAPARLEITYGLTLANIVPAASSFTVKVNTVTRTVNSVAISGTKVLLTLSGPVVYGDVVTVAYSKPATNPLQTSAGGQVASIAAQNVTNNVAAAIANQPPVITITSPTKSISFIEPANITIEATASDQDGSIIRVEFYNGTTKIGECFAAPFSFNWKEVPGGIYTITAVAVDNMNAKTNSAVVEVIVEKSINAINQLPVVSITKPNMGKKHKKHDNVVIEAVASDPDGIITKVEFKCGSTILAELTTAPYIYIWEDVDTGSYRITAIATDNLGAASNLSEAEFFVTDINDPNSESINLYPNPNDGHFTIDIYTGLPSNNNKIAIFSLSGEKVFYDMITDQEGSREFDLSNSACGTYVMEIISGNTIIATKKFIIR